MFEQYKLNKYKKYIKGFAYECIAKRFYHDIQIYIVIKKSDDYSFIKFRKYKEIYIYDLDRVLNILNDNEHYPMAHYLKKEQPKLKII